MGRKGKVKIREVAPDPVYGEIVVERLINRVMVDGKKNLARWIVYTAFKVVSDRTSRDPVEVFKQALGNIMPLCEVRSRRVGGATYQIPVECIPRRKEFLGLKWLVEAASVRNDVRGMENKLAREILDAYEGKGGAVRKKEEVHKIAEANRAFAHYRW